MNYRTLSRAMWFAPAICIVLTACGGNRNPDHIEAIRAFESGAIDLSIEIEPLSDGYSTLYRASVVDRHRQAASLVSGDLGQQSIVADGVLEHVDYRWAVDGATVPGESETFFAFRTSRELRISVAALIDGRNLASARRRITVSAIGARQPGETLYLSLSQPGEAFAVPGAISGVAGEASLDAGLGVVGTGDAVTVLRATEAGFYHVESRDSDATYETNVFVSPIPTYHVDRTDRDWYFTQFRTRTTSNCGPSVVSMGIAWATGADIPVSMVRSHIGWTGSGAVSMPELKRVLDRYEVGSRLHWIDEPGDIFEILDRGHLVGVVYDMAGISFTENPDEDLFGQYYIDAGGHYLMVKGYSLDGEYFVVYDPIPSDWVANAGRYGDGMSMYGRNRYYRVDELFPALRSRQIIEIMRQGRR